MDIYSNKFSLEIRKKEQFALVNAANCCTNDLKFDVFRKHTHIHKYISHHLHNSDEEKCQVHTFWFIIFKTIITELNLTEIKEHIKKTWL